MTQTIRNEFHCFVDDFLKEYFAFHPEIATASGIHTHDHRISDFSQSGIARDSSRLKHALSRLNRIGARTGEGSVEGLPPQLRLDFQIMKGTLEAALFELEEMRSWERNPSVYNDLLNASLFLLMKRAFAPLRTRVRAIIERERQIPGALAAARKNLRRVPRMMVQLAIRQFEGTLHFLEHTLPAVATETRDPGLLAEFEDSNREAMAAFSGFISFLRERLLPRGPERFGIGEYRYRRKLWLEEWVDLPLEHLLAKAHESLKENHEMFHRLGSSIDRRKDPEEILDLITRDHPAGDQVLAVTAGVLGQLQDFLVQRDLISLPPISRASGQGTLCTVNESPEFLRELTFASLDVPGPFEKKAREYYYYVTLPDPKWSPEAREQHLRFFSHHLILTTSIHEAYPGHLVHFLWVNRHPSKVRRLFGATSHVEGWAHYCEQMMIEQGFGEGDPRLHMAQLHEAQLRLCRFIVGIEMHAGSMSFRQAKNFFIRNAHMQPVNADREAKRGVVDPTYLVYTLGKMQLLRLREELQRRQGAGFSLKKFHNACVQNGFPPIPLLRELLLGERRAVI
ncbi:MAG: DUF885 domain-containing protein [Acidobacteriia bacterium]|nr:DUF885 domain-containing protein [Terriglobia bacterium]